MLKRTRADLLLQLLQQRPVGRQDLLRRLELLSQFGHLGLGGLQSLGLLQLLLQQVSEDGLVPLQQLSEDTHTAGSGLKLPTDDARSHLYGSPVLAESLLRLAQPELCSLFGGRFWFWSGCRAVVLQHPLLLPAAASERFKHRLISDTVGLTGSGPTCRSPLSAGGTRPSWTREELRGF